MLIKKIESLEEAKMVIKNANYQELESMKIYYPPAIDEAYDKYLEMECQFEEDGTETFMKVYNAYVDFRIANPVEFMAIVKHPKELSRVCEMRDEWVRRNSHSSIPRDAEWLSRKEIEKKLNNGGYVYIIKNKEHRIEKEIESMNELDVI